MDIELQRYTASEAESITGVSQDVVRNWRRHGYLPPIIGHARFNVLELAMLQIMGALSERNVGPKVSAPFARQAAVYLFMQLAWSHLAWSEKVKAAASASVQATLETKHNIPVIAKESGVEVDVARKMVFEGECSLYVAQAAKKLVGMSGIESPTWALIWADGEIEFMENLDPLSYDHFFAEARFQGPLILLSLGAMAQKMANALTRPAIKMAGES